jgi:hypothetical protein
MKLISKIIWVLVGVWLITPNSSSAQSGWSKKKGELFAQLTFSNFASDKFYSTDGTLRETGVDFQHQAINLYSEYGLTDNFTLLLNAPLLKFNSFESTETVAGVGDIRLGVKYQFIKSLPTSISIEAEIPTGDAENFAKNKNLNDLGFREQVNLPLSDGEFNVWLTLASSKSTNNGKFYGSAFVAYNERTKGFSSQLQVGAEAGYLFFDKLWLIGKMRIQETISPTDELVNFLLGERTEYTSFGVTALYKITKKWRLTASYSNYGNLIVSQKNLYDGATYSLGVAIEL